MTRRRWIADTWSPQTGHPTQAALTGEQAAHLARVLRAQPGQVFDIVANGFLHRAEITSVSDDKVLFTLHEELEADAALPIHLLLAVSKQSRRTDVPEILDPTPLAAALQREAAPHRILLSETEQTLTLASALTQPATTNGVPHPSQPHRDGWDLDRPLALAIGPEGGWTPEEMSLFTTHNWTHVTLGPRILRAETAAIAAIAIASSHLA